jgi:hypothetical protein
MHINIGKNFAYTIREKGVVTAVKRPLPLGFRNIKAEGKYARTSAGSTALLKALTSKA